MSTTHGTTWLERKSVSTRHVSSFIWKYWDAFQERRERQKLRATLSDLSDRELMDIGTTRIRGPRLTAVNLCRLFGRTEPRAAEQDCRRHLGKSRFAPPVCTENHIRV